MEEMHSGLEPFELRDVLSPQDEPPEHAVGAAAPFAVELGIQDLPQRPAGEALPIRRPREHAIADERLESVEEQPALGLRERRAHLERDGALTHAHGLAELAGVLG